MSSTRGLNYAKARLKEKAMLPPHLLAYKAKYRRTLYQPVISKKVLTRAEVTARLLAR